MTKLHKLIRISHDGTTFFYPAGNRTEHGPLFDSEAPVAERRLRRPRPKRPDRSLAAHCPNGGTGSAPARRTRKTARRTGHERRETPEPAETIPFSPANAARPVRTGSKWTRPKYLRFFNKKALRARSGIRRFRIISYLRSRNRGRPCRPQRRPLRQATLIRTSETNDRYTF